MLRNENQLFFITVGSSRKIVIFSKALKRYFPEGFSIQRERATAICRVHIRRLQIAEAGRHRWPS